jgi:hypothetical protein
MSALVDDALSDCGNLLATNNTQLTLAYRYTFIFHSLLRRMLLAARCNGFIITVAHILTRRVLRVCA